MKKTLERIVPKLYGKWLNFIAFFSPRTAAKIGFDIFCTIRKGRVKPEQVSFLDAAKHSVELIGEQQIQTYTWKGTKETVLLLHGWESNTYRWRNLIAKLKEHNFNIIAFDAPAHGHSTGKMLHVPLYAASTRYILDKFNPDYVVAHSMGGMTILFDHFLNPKDHVKKIVTIGSPCDFESFMHHYQAILKFNDKVWKAMDQRLKRVFGFHINEFKSSLFVANNKVPGLLFHDIEDKQVLHTESIKVHESWNNSRLVLTTGLGHSMHQEEVNEEIITFLESN